MELSERKPIKQTDLTRSDAQGKNDLRTPRGGGVGTTPPPGFWSSRRNFSKIYNTLKLVKTLLDDLCYLWLKSGTGSWCDNMSKQRKKK